MYNFIIIGSGPAGVASALELSNCNTLMLDVGFTPNDIRLPENNLYDINKKETDLYPLLIGENHEGIEHLSNATLNLKLKSPLMRYITNSADSLMQNTYSNFSPTLSYAEGGLANAWGGGLMCYNDDDLKNFPIKEKDLKPFYETLIEHIGISGENDDLGKFLAYNEKLLKPLDLSPISQNFLNAYNIRKETINNHSIYIGKMRSGLISNYNTNYKNTYKNHLNDFFQSRNEGFYTPSRTLHELVKTNKIDYMSGFLVEAFKENSSYVEVFAKEIKTNNYHSFKANKLLIGAGTINSSKIILNSNNDYESKLSLLENPICFLPFLDISLIGTPFPKNAYPGAELMAIMESKESGNIQASIYGLYGPLRSDIISELPFSIKLNLKILPYISPALGMLQLFFPDNNYFEKKIKLNSNNSLDINCKEIQTKDIEFYSKKFLKLLFSMRYISSKRLLRKPKPGSSIHYAGTLPMKLSPKNKYETDINGLLYGKNNTHIIDAANFSSLPAKNHSLTIMANSMRIARFVKNNLLGSEYDK